MYLSGATCVDLYTCTCEYSNYIVLLEPATSNTM